MELLSSSAAFYHTETYAFSVHPKMLKPGGYCVLVLGDVERDGEYRHTAEILSNLAKEATSGRLMTETIYDDLIPDERRARRRTKTTKFERILVMRKQ